MASSCGVYLWLLLAFHSVMEPNTPDLLHPHVLFHIMNENNNNLQQNVNRPSELPDTFVASFSRLLLNVSGDTETLNRFQSMISDEIEKAPSPNVSNSDSKRSDIDLFSTTGNANEDTEAVDYTVIRDDTDINTQDPVSDLVDDHKVTESLISHTPAFLSKEAIEELRLEQELQELFSGLNNGNKYIWLANLGMPVYSFGRGSYEPNDILACIGVKSLLDKINLAHNLQLDSCLVTRYISSDVALSLHQDNEEILDGSHPIVVTSIGGPRTLQFWDSNSENNGELIEEVELIQGDLLVMKPGCQEVLWHKVLPNQSPTASGIRYALSFRRIKPTILSQQEQHPLQPPLTTSSPAQELKPQPGTGFLVHPSRIHQSSTRVNTAAALPITHSSNKATAKHLIIGDSMVNGLRVSGSTCIFKGGIRPHEVLGLLPSSEDLIHPNHYDDVRSVTLVVGTNALNINNPNKATPLLDVVDDYERLVDDLRTLFPNARIGLYNVLPRASTYHETRERIGLFNSIFEHASRRFKRIFWIRQYSDFLDEYGYMREDLYGKLGIHLKPKGKSIMARAIKNFQNSYN